MAALGAIVGVRSEVVRARGDGQRPPRPRRRHRLPGHDHRWHAAGRGGRLDRPRRVDRLRPARRPARRRPRLVGARPDGPLSRALDDRHRRRRAAGPRLPPRPRRHPLGAAAPPLRAVAGAPARGRRLARVRLRRAAGHRPVAGVRDPGRVAQPHVARARDPAAPLPPRRRRDAGHGRRSGRSSRPAAGSPGSRSRTTSGRASPRSRRSSTARSRGPSPAGRWRR